MSVSPHHVLSTQTIQDLREVVHPLSHFSVINLEEARSNSASRPLT